MESIYLLIPIALLFVSIGVWVFFWAVDNGQFDDLEGPAHSILFDDDMPHTRDASPSDQQLSPDQPSADQPPTENQPHHD